MKLNPELLCRCRLEIYVVSSVVIPNPLEEWNKTRSILTMWIMWVVGHSIGGNIIIFSPISQGFNQKEID